MTQIEPRSRASHANPLPDVNSVRTVYLPSYRRDGGEIVVAEVAANVPFAIVRVFTIKAPMGAERGKHAHRQCSQFMICVSGAVEIVCDDGCDRRSFILDRSDMALMVPPTLWNSVTFRESGSVVTVLCDRPYEEWDYIRDYSAFLAYRTSAQS